MSYHGRKYNLNEDFFSKWSSTMSYVLGFWFADGYMRKEKSYRVVFSSKDKSILIKIRRVFDSNHPVHPTENNCYFISLCSKKLYQDLVRLGGFRKKSKILSFPYVPLMYQKNSYLILLEATLMGMVVYFS